MWYVKHCNFLAIKTFPFFCRRNFYVLNHKFSKLINVDFDYILGDQNRWLPTKSKPNKKIINAFSWQVSSLTTQLWNHISKLLASVKCLCVCHGSGMTNKFKMASSYKELRYFLNSYKICWYLLPKIWLFGVLIKKN